MAVDEVENELGISFAVEGFDLNKFNIKSTILQETKSGRPGLSGP